MKNTILTEEEKDLICQVVCDLLTGNHLLRPRSAEYWEFAKVLSEAKEAKEPTEKQRQMVEYCRQCSNYSYWKNLPENEKMF